MSQKRVKFSDLPINARHKLTHYKRLYKKNELPTYIIQELKKENMLYLVESKTLTNSQISKDQLLELARNGQDRPNKNTKIGRFLNEVCRISSSVYDFSFVTELKQLRPDWFRNSKKHIYKDQLLELAKTGQPRPSRKTKLGRVLNSICVTNGGSHDLNFSAELKQLRPDWFQESRKKMNIEQLFELAKSGQPRPHYKTKLAIFLNHINTINDGMYDPIVSAEIKQLRPDWFRQ